MLDREQVRTFARRGFVVVPQVVPQELLAQASRAIDREPPPRQVRGHHVHFLPATKGPGTASAADEESSAAVTTAEQGRLDTDEPWDVTPRRTGRQDERRLEDREERRRRPGRLSRGRRDGYARR